VSSVLTMSEDGIPGPFPPVISCPHRRPLYELWFTTALKFWFKTTAPPFTRMPRKTLP